MATVRSYMCVCRRVVERTDNVNGESWNANDIWVIASDYLYEQQDTLGAVSCAASGNARVFMSQSRSLFFTSIDSPLFLIFLYNIYFTAIGANAASRLVNVDHSRDGNDWRSRGEFDAFLRAQRAEENRSNPTLHAFQIFTLIRHFMLIKNTLKPKKKKRRADKAEFLFYVFWNFVGRRCKSS